jgi:3-hydroxyisobutyrate dehydrogenase-like beta-hydroxyacid dehydrogenase
MDARRIGILHPGQMGIVVAVSARNSGNEVFWASEGRSADTRKRASDAGLKDAGTLAKLCELCPVIVSVCPPEFAEEIAAQVAQHSYHATYVDANAITPERTQRIAHGMEACGGLFVDGSIIGPPSNTRNRTWLCLSGDQAATIAPYFSAGPVEVDIIAGGIGRASALKMCFAAYTKGSTALACAVLASAERLEVFDDLRRHFERNGPSLPTLEREIVRAAPKAWRYIAEMREIAATFQSAGMPPEFHQAAAEIFRRLEDFKGRQDPEVKDVLGTLLK